MKNETLDEVSLPIEEKVKLLNRENLRLHKRLEKLEEENKSLRFLPKKVKDLERENRRLEQISDNQRVIIKDLKAKLEGDDRVIRREVKETEIYKEFENVKNRQKKQYSELRERYYIILGKYANLVSSIEKESTQYEKKT